MKVYRLWVLLLCSMLSIGISAQDAHWSYDPYAYQYDMTAYVKMVDQAGRELSLNDYELAAFVGDECRGIAVSSESNGSEYGYLRIRSNASGEEVSFKAYDKSKQREWVVGETMTFQSDGLQGMPSSPIALTVHVLYKVSFLIDDEVFDEQELEYGAEITAPVVQEREGYTFSGWSEIPETMPANDLTVTGTFTINSYKVFYKVDGEDYKAVEVTYGATIPEEVAPAKEGYTFSGWSEIPETMPANNITVTGTFTINTYKVFYKVDGEDYKTVEVTYGATIPEEGAPEKVGYTFSGWSEIPSTMPANDITVTGTFTINSYKVYYKVDGEDYKTVEVTYGATIPEEVTPAKEGYTFSGWSEIPATMPANDLTVTGTFTINTYKVFYKVDGEDYKTVEVAYGETIPEEVAPEKEGYTFSGWSEVPETMPANDLTVTGTFTINTYKVFYKVEGEDYKTVEVTYGEVIPEEFAPEKEGYTFSGWSEVPETMPANDLTVTGSFTINQYVVRFFIVYDGETILDQSQTLDYGSVITAPEVEEKEGTHFSWIPEVDETVPAHDVTYEGRYLVDTYLIYYKVDNESYKTVELQYGDAIVLESAPEKEGYTFSGWSEVPETMPANNITVTGTFTINTYKVFYKVDGEDYKTVEVTYGVAIPEEVAPEKEGYTFSGWSEVPETMPANDITVTGTFTINTYKVFYKVDGEDYKTVEVTYGVTIPREVAPEKEGYTFSGWSEVPTTMPANDITVTGTFTINQYVVRFFIVYDGQTILDQSQTLDYGSVITAPEVEEKEGTHFSWIPEVDETVPAHDVTYEGRYLVDTYLIYYKVDNESYKTVELQYGDAIVLESAPEKEGYTFSGWSEVPETMPANNITVTGTFSINTYKVFYKVDGEDYKTVEVTYGETIPEEPAPEKEGYTFSGWSEIPETMPAQDITVEGTFTEDPTVGISSTRNGQGMMDNTIIYNLSGQRINAPQKGINIINGRKIFVK